MKIEETICLMKFMRNGYQKLIDENCAEGTVVGTDVIGTWKSNTPLTEVYQKHIDACDMAIEALEKQVPMKTLGPELDAFSGRAVFSCRNCGERISPMQKYCLWCGQKAL